MGAAPSTSGITQGMNRTFNLPIVDARYREVVALVNGGATLSNAMEIGGSQDGHSDDEEWWLKLDLVTNEPSPTWWNTWGTYTRRL